MPVKISPLKILNDLGYEMVDIESDEDYLSALMESIVSLQGDGGSGRARADILQEELIRLRKERKAAAPSAGMKITQKKISTSKFFGKDENKTDAVTQKKSSPNGSTGDIGGSLQQIATGVNSIVETLKEDYKQDEKFGNWEKRQEEKKKRKSKESKLEAKKFDGIKKTATKLLKPFKSAWNRVFDFLKTVFFGRILFKLMDWVSDPQNQKKLQSILRFVKDWWPMLLTAYLLFGNAFGRMAVKLTVMISRFAVKLITKIIPKLVAGLGKMKAGKLLNMIPGGKGIGGKLLTSGALLGGGMLLGNAMAGGGDEDTTADLDTMQFEGQFNGGGLVNNYNQFITNYNGGGLIQGFKDGGFAGLGKDQQTFIQEKMAQAQKTSTEVANAAPGRELDPIVNLFMDQLKDFYGITNTVAGSISDGAGGFRMQSQSELNKENNEKLPLGLKMTEDGLNIDLGRAAADQVRMVGKLASDPKHADRLKEIGKQFGYDNLTGKQLTEISNQQADDMQFDVNRFIPGTESHRLDVVANEINQKTSKRNMVSGGFVSGPGGIDQVPARLTAGEFVMSKGAVQKYGANTLAAMNAAGGGTNRPTMGRYNEGGLVQPIVEAGSINSYEDAIKAGVKIEDIVAGGMRFGSIKWTEKMPRGLFGLGKQKYQTKGTKWNVSGTGGGADKELAMSTKDYVNKKMGWTTGAAANVSGSETNKSSNTGILGPISSNVDSMVNSAGFTPVAKKDMDLNPVSKNNVLLDYQKEGGQLDSDMQKAEIQTVSSKEVPDFDPKAMRSAAKIQVLGISL